MNHDPFVCEIRCPVHGFIGLTDLEREIVNHPAFQRLRRIKQLAWTDYVYPGASHSRFEHSLGVMHLASRLYEAIVTVSGDTLKDVFKYTDAGLSRDWQVVRLAGLLHDIGHPPFSHATEYLLPIKVPGAYPLFPGTEIQPEKYSHEDYSVGIIRTILKELIEQYPSNRRNHRITVDEVTALLSKRAPVGANLFWKDLISGQLDADRMDYLLRDSLHAGVSYGRFDLDRIVSTICVVRRPTEESIEPKIAITKGGVFAAEALIVARYWMHKQVYFHKTRLVYDHHLGKAMQAILSGQQRFKTENAYYPSPDSAEGLSEFLKWDDYRVMGLIVNGEGGEHGERLLNRNHYRLVCELEESDATVSDLNESIKRNSGVLAALGSMVKFVTQPKALWYKTKAASELVLVDDKGNEEIGFLSSYSALMKSINVGSIQFVYVDKPDAEAAKKKCKELLKVGLSKDDSDVGVVAVPGAEPVPVPEAADPPPEASQLVLEAVRPDGKPVQGVQSHKKGVQDAV